MTKSSKEQIKTIDNKLLDPGHDEILAEGVRIVGGSFKFKLLKYGLLIFLIGCGLTYVVPNFNFDVRSSLNKFEEFWYNISNLKPNTKTITVNTKSLNIDPNGISEKKDDADRTHLSENSTSHLDGNIKSLRKRIDSLESQFRVFDQTNHKYISKDILPMGKNFVKLKELVKSQELTERALKKLTSRIVALEGTGIDKLSYTNEIRDEVSRQQERISIINDRLSSVIGSLDLLASDGQQSSLHSPMPILSLSNLLTTIRQEKPFRVQLEAFRLSVGDKLEAKKYIKQLEKYASKGIPNTRSLLKRLVSIYSNLQTREGLKGSGLIQGALIELRSLVKIRKIKNPGDNKSIPKSFDAAIEALQNNNLKLAINHMKQLELTSINVVKFWLDEAQSLSNLEGILPKLESMVLFQTPKSE